MFVFSFAYVLSAAIHQSDVFCLKIRQETEILCLKSVSSAYCMHLGVNVNVGGCVSERNKDLMLVGVFQSVIKTVNVGGCVCNVM